MSETTINIFEQASRDALRFATSRGLITVEDLWNLPLTATDNKLSLDQIAQRTYAELESARKQHVSFVEPAEISTSSEIRRLENALEVIKHIIAVKISARDEYNSRKERDAKKQKLLEILARKQDDALEQKTEDELIAMLNSL